MPHWIGIAPDDYEWSFRVKTLILHRILSQKKGHKPQELFSLITWISLRQTVEVVEMWADWWYISFPVSLVSTCLKGVKNCWYFFSCVDLKTMSERLKNRYYVSKKLFMADLQRVFTNCKEYNPPESEYYRCANVLEKFFFSKIKEAGLIDKWHFFPLLLRNSPNSVPKAWFSFTKSWT